MDKLNQEYADQDLQVLLINMKEELSTITSYIETHNISSRVLLDVNREVAKKYEVRGIPISFLIDREGRVAARLRGYADWESKEIRSLLDNLINEKST